MQHMTKAGQSGLLDRFAPGRMRVNGGGDILQQRAHFEREPEGRGQFRDIMSDGLQAEHPVIIGACHNADKSRFVVLAQGTAIDGAGGVLGQAFGLRETLLFAIGGLLIGPVAGLLSPLRSVREMPVTP